MTKQQEINTANREELLREEVHKNLESNITALVKRASEKELDLILRFVKSVMGLS